MNFSLGDLSCLQCYSALSVCPWTCIYFNSQGLGTSVFEFFTWVPLVPSVLLRAIGLSMDFEVILNDFWTSSGRIFGPFWGHVQLKSPLRSSLRAFLRLEVDFPSSTPTIWEGFGELLGSILEMF